MPPKVLDTLSKKSLKEMKELLVELLGKKSVREKLLKGNPENNGRRIAPAQVGKQDDRFKFRIDQGAVLEDGTYTLVMQQNGVPHGKALAKITVDPSTDTADDVSDRLVDDFGKQLK